MLFFALSLLKITNLCVIMAMLLCVWIRDGFRSVFVAVYLISARIERKGNDKVGNNQVGFLAV